MLEQAETENNTTYQEVVNSGLASLLCLGCEVFGRWSPQCVKLVPTLARERTRRTHPRLRRGLALSLLHRWWGVLGIALQTAVAHLVLSDPAGVDLVQMQLDPSPPFADLPVM